MQKFFKSANFYGAILKITVAAIFWNTMYKTAWTIFCRWLIFVWFQEQNVWRTRITASFRTGMTSSCQK